ncbi:cytochrome c oxidase subunit 5B, mitochondrial-like [Dendropsophus ebraccatus]|uniref:cytochrome c oxidase subunit 5B, mitochondrial-like n=1 Tax=Dendropsophus ebraccatus TaxID=150705 RepID=UPI0038319B85
MSSYRFLQLVSRSVPRAAAYPRAVYLSRPCVRAMSAGGIPTDEEQATGLERKVLTGLKKGEDPFNVHKPKAYPGTKENPHIVPSINKQRIVGCICEEDNSQIIWFWAHEGQVDRCPQCGAHYKLVPYELPH